MLPCSKREENSHDQRKEHRQNCDLDLKKKRTTILRKGFPFKFHRTDRWEEANRRVDCRLGSIDLRWFANRSRFQENCALEWYNQKWPKFDRKIHRENHWCRDTYSTWSEFHVHRNFSRLDWRFDSKLSKKKQNPEIDQRRSRLHLRGNCWWDYRIPIETVDWSLE